MSDVKKYKIDYNLSTEVVVEIDHKIMTDKKLHEINDFWGGQEDRIHKEGSVLDAVLKLLTAKVLQIEMSGAYPIAGIEKDFDYSNGRGHEGWPKMDGSEGIKIISVDEYEFEFFDMDISVV